MSGASTGQVTSADGTSIVFDRSGAGPLIILVHGAFTGRAHPLLSEVAAVTNAGKAVARTIPAAAHRVLQGQTHNVSPQALAPELLEFFTT